MENSIRKIFVDYLDTKELVYEYMRDNSDHYKQDEEGEYSLEDERDALDILIQGIVDTMDTTDFFDILEGYIDPEIEYFFKECDIEVFKQFKYAVLTDPQVKSIMKRVSGLKQV